MPDPFPLEIVTHAQRVIEDALDGVRDRLLATTGNVEVVTKGDGTPVTAIDLEVDAHLATAIAASFPTHAILSEERETVAPEVEWTWIVDPIDGTSNFIAGLPYWCVSVALAHRGTVVLGVVDAPAVDRRYVAIRGEGAHRDGTRLQVRPPVDARDPRNAHIPVMLTTGTARRAHTAGVRLNPRVMGSTALDLAIVAEGTAVASIAVRPHVWDIAAGSLLVTEAGGVAVHLGNDTLLPLRPDVDHGDLAVAFAAAADRSYVEDLSTGLLPEA